MSRTIGAVRQVQGCGYDSNNTDDTNVTSVSLLDIGIMLQRIMSSVKLRQVSQVGTKVLDVPEIKTFQSKGRHSSISPEELSEQWQIGIEQARETLKRTTQRLV